MTVEVLSRAQLEARQNEIKVLLEAARRRQAELVDEWARVRLRRDEVRAERMRLRADLRLRQAAASGRDGRAAAAILEAAVQVTGMSSGELWLDYVSVGGDASPEELEGMLSGRSALRRPDHDRLVVVLNQRFADAGMGRPLAYWDGSR